MKTLDMLKKYLLPLSSLLLLGASCDSFVAVDLPESQLSRRAVFEDKATATAALAAIYAKIRDTGLLIGDGSGLSSQLGCYADELVPFGSPTKNSWFFYNNSLLPTNSSISQYWNNSYNQIYAANAVIEGLKGSTLTEETQKQLKGEALFIRALVHFYLTNLYGAIPYVMVTDYTTNSRIDKIPTAEVYQKSISDLQTAVSLLLPTYPSSGRLRVNRYAAQALLARVYLYARRYAEASNEASAVLNASNLYQLETDLNQVFLIASKESIWMLQAANAGQNTKEGSLFILTATPPTNVALTENLVASFDPLDERRLQWIQTISNSSTSWYYAFKYKERNTTPSSKEYSVVLRLAEQYLIRAEARAQQGDLIGAQEDLHVIRHRAGLLPSTASTKEALLLAVLQERRKELFCEQGHRFFDLKRYGQLDAALATVKAGWTTTDALFPLPQNELNTNPKLLPQNTGY
ncbi:RagB/SusD family nutrient uptake outer membrane protein [Flavobacterium sp. ST-87]|uniref:RagB/SusD family nutrient uptake outer membrane protein n=1 Tax=Flavobacterium plantiphilum TaxID=3163297 RepID=A0ABW8XR20_9FLAO